MQLVSPLIVINEMMQSETINVFQELTQNVLNTTSVLALERKISVRANREELVSKGILLPESPLSLKSEPGELLFSL